MNIKIKYNICLYNSIEKKLYKSAIMPNEKHLLDINIVKSDNENLFCSGIYGIDKSFGENPNRAPVDQSSHCCDARIYWGYI